MQPLLLSREKEIQELQQIFDSDQGGAFFFLFLWLWIIFEIFLYAQQVKKTYGSLNLISVS